jgi:hypothetical protein
MPFHSSWLPIGQQLAWLRLQERQRHGQVVTQLIEHGGRRSISAALAAQPYLRILRQRRLACICHAA